MTHRRNKNFTGLFQNDGANIKKYMHFRNVQSAAKKELINKEDAIYCYDIFDCIECDQPTGIWSIVFDTIHKKAEIKSFLWPGYYAFHIGHTSLFGGAYFGNGIKNKDVGFML